MANCLATALNVLQAQKNAKHARDNARVTQELQEMLAELHHLRLARDAASSRASPKMRIV
jgi:hypothetical protein